MNHTQYKWWFPRLFEILVLCFFELCCSFIANWVLAKIGNSKWIRDFKATALRSKIFLKKCYFPQEESKRSPMTVELIIEDIKSIRRQREIWHNSAKNIYNWSNNFISALYFVIVCVCYCPLRAVHCRIPYIQTPGIERQNTSYISRSH